MNKVLFVIFSLILLTTAYAQEKPQKSSKLGRELGVTEPNDSIKKEKRAKITDYLIISHVNDTTYLDTTLSIKKEYNRFESVSNMEEFGFRMHYLRQNDCSVEGDVELADT